MKSEHTRAPLYILDSCYHFPRDTIPIEACLFHCQRYNDDWDHAFFETDFVRLTLCSVGTWTNLDKRFQNIIWLRFLHSSREANDEAEETNEQVSTTAYDVTLYDFCHQP